MTAASIIKHPVFESISIVVIVSNSIILAFEDPTTTDPSPIFDTFDDVFLSLYTIEMVLKVRYVTLIF